MAKIWPMVMLLFATYAHASDYSSAQQAPAGRSTSGGTEVDFQPSPAEIYEQFELTPDEWATYQRLMKGPLGVKNPSISPLLALAHAADSEEEARRYLRIQIRLDKHVWDRGKQVASLHREEFSNLYPDLLPLDRSKLYASDDRVQPGDRFILTVNSACTNCNKLVSQFVDKTAVFPSNAFDIFVQDAFTDDQVVEWAKLALRPTQFDDGRVTLNAHNPHLAQSVPSTDKVNLLVRRGNRLFPVPQFQLLVSSPDNP